MSYGTQRLYGNGLDPATIGKVDVAASYPLLLTAASVDFVLTPGSAAADETNDNQKLTNMGGSHHMALTSISNHDLLNGAVLEKRNGSKGVMFGLNESGGSAAIKDNWVAGIGLGGTIGATSSVAAAALPSLSSNAAPILSKAPNANMLLFIIAELSAGFDRDNLKECGFDLRGFYQTASDVVGGIGIRLGEGAGGYGAGAMHAFTAPSTWDQAYREQVAIPSTLEGLAVQCLAVNGTGATLGAGSYGGVMQAEDATASTASGTGWAIAPNGDAISLDLGEGADSDKIGFYAMGIRNYDAAITRQEIELVCDFMGHSGKLPPWWSS